MIQRVFDCLEPVLPDGWNKLVFYAEYDGASYSMEYYVKSGGSFVKCFDIPGLSRRTLLSTFSEIDEVISSEREKLSGKNLWTNLTMVVQENGRVKVDLGYEDLTEGSYAHKKAWKTRYLV